MYTRIYIRYMQAHELKNYASNRVYFQGMKFLHESALGSHGHLSSACCYVDGRWTLKVGDVGLHWLKKIVNYNGKQKEKPGI